MLKHELTYEIMRPESVGAPGHAARARQALGHARSRRALPRARPPAAPAGARTPLRQGHGACRSHQVGRRRAAGRHHSRRAGAPIAAGRSRRLAHAETRHVTEDCAAARRRHRPGSHRGSRPHPEERRASIRASRFPSRRTPIGGVAIDSEGTGLPERTLEARVERGCGAARRGRPSEVRRPAAVGASRSGAARVAPGARRIRQSAPGGLLRAAREANAVPARARARRQPADRPRAAGRPVFRRAARLRSLGQHRVQHADLLTPRDRARGQGGIRARARAPQEGRVDRQGQRPRDVAPVARGRVGSRPRAIPTSSSSTSTSIPRRCAWRPRRPAST